MLSRASDCVDKKTTLTPHKVCHDETILEQTTETQRNGERIEQKKRTNALLKYTLKPNRLCFIIKIIMNFKIQIKSLSYFHHHHHHQSFSRFHSTDESQ
jgi:hypothetical protein